MNNHRVYKRWMIFSAIVIGFFGPTLFFGTMSATAEPARLGLDVLAWPIDGFPSYESAEIRFLSALTGGFLLGWGVTIGCLALWVYDLAPEGVRRSLIVGTLAWFMLDSAGSITSGNPMNAAFNVIVLLLIVGPMWRPAADTLAIEGKRQP